MSVLSDTQFAVSLLNKSSSDESFVFSPMSLSIALSAIHAGSKGETKEEIRKALVGGASDDKLFKYYKSINASLQKKGDALLGIGNRVYLKNDLKAEKAYQNKVYRNLSTKIASLHFENAGESTKTVNAFIKKNTNGVSKNPIHASLFSTPDVNAIIVSTASFSCKWKHKFLTDRRDFQAKDGLVSKEQFLFQSDVYGLYFASEEVEVLTLPYTDKKYAFTVVLPKEKFGLANVKSGLTGEKLQDLLKSVKETNMDIFIPKFNLEIDTDAAALLKEQGINKVFSKQAELEGISQGVWISQMSHKAIIGINENGSGDVSANLNPKEKELLRRTNSTERVIFDACHPFLFFICRKDKIIFSGQYLGKEQPDLCMPVEIMTEAPPLSEESELCGIQFGLSFLKQLAKDESVVFSPMSISFALALVFLGAKDKVKEEIRNGLLGDVSDEELLNYFRSIYAFLRDNSEVFMRIANRLFVRNGFIIQPSYLREIAKNFAADAVNLDFDDAEGAAMKVSKYIEKATEGMIPDCVGPDAFDGDMNALITNVIYFEAPWLHVFAGFSEEDTFTFHPNRWTSKKVQYLHESEMYDKYTETDEVKVLRLRYEDQKYTFTMILPKEKFGLEAFLKSLTAQKLQNLIKNLKQTSISVTFPKFKFETDVDATSILKSLGIGGMFSKEANLEGIAPNVSIGSMKHKAIIDVNENGTRAAAATVFRGCGSYGPEFSFTADHPFLFFICREDKVLFSGQYCG